jgi:hypothetical protein
VNRALFVAWRTCVANVAGVIVGACLLLTLSWCVCGCTKQQAAAAMSGALVTAKETLDATERVEGDRAIDAAVRAGVSQAQAELQLEAVREQWRPVWVSLSTALAATLAYAEGDGGLAAAEAAYCALARSAPTLKLPAVVPCKENAP